MWSQFKRWAQRLYEPRIVALEGADAGLAADIAALEAYNAGPSDERFECLNDTASNIQIVPLSTLIQPACTPGEVWEYGLTVHHATVGAADLTIRIMLNGIGFATLGPYMPGWNLLHFGMRFWVQGDAGTPGSGQGFMQSWRLDPMGGSIVYGFGGVTPPVKTGFALTVEAQWSTATSDSNAHFSNRVVRRLA